MHRSEGMAWHKNGPAESTLNGSINSDALSKNVCRQEQGRELGTACSLAKVKVN